jgi:hypothetical protein
MNPREPSAENPAGAPPPESAPAVCAFPRWLKIALAVADPLSLAALLVFMLTQSWLRWMDPLIDFPRSLYVAWRLREGDLLYDQVVSWYGPLPHLVEAAAFRLFGVGLDTMVWLNIAVAVVVLLLLRAIFGALGNRWTGWLCTMVFLCVFVVGHYRLVANYNFITPYASQATYGFAGLLLVLWALLRQLKSERPSWLGIAGLGLAITYLDKPEPLLAAMGSLGIYGAVGFIHRARSPAPTADWSRAGRWAIRAASWLAGGFLCVWLPVFAFFLSRGGLAYALHAADYVPATMLNSSFRHTVENSPFMQTLFGFDQPWANFLSQLGAGALLVVLCLIMTMAARDWTRQPWLGEAWWTLLLVVLAAGAVAEWLAWHADLVIGTGRAFVFPVWLAAGAYCLRSGWLAWRGRGDYARALGLAVVGTAAALMLARMILNGRLTHFGFFMMPLAVLFWIHMMMVEAARPAPGARRVNGLLPAVFSLILLFDAGALARANLGIYAGKNYPVGEGRDRFYTFEPQFYPAGGVLNIMLQAFKNETPNAKSLVVFPEGVAVNYLLRVRCPLAELEFQPAALSYAGSPHVLDELQARPPEVVMIYDRSLLDYGTKYFGDSASSGRDIVQWLNTQYKVVGTAGSVPDSLTGHTVDLLVPKGTPGRSGLPLLPNPQ